jgi:hypothetical protein
MSHRIFYPFHPERILWTGAAVLFAGGSLSLIFLVFWLGGAPLLFPSGRATAQTVANEGKPLVFSFHLKEVPIAFPIPRVEPEMTFSFDPPRPDGGGRSGDLFVRFKQSAQSKRVSLPCRIDLQFNGSALSFGSQDSQFWLELTAFAEGKIQGVVWIETAHKEKMKAETFIASPQASPLQGPFEFSEGSPFRILGEARWLGHDVFAEKYGRQQTLLIAVGQAHSQILDLREKEWIVWRDGCWMKGNLEAKPEAASRIESVDSKALILQGWNGEAHVRLSLPYSPPAPFKMRGEEIFHSIRVRSEKQISCMMEKQCLILKAGDSVLKSNGRWRVLRKKEEKEAYQTGKIGGELFIFEKIESKQGQKSISGFLFNPEKTQVVPVDLPVHKNARKEAKEK